MNIGVKISGTGMYVPPRVVTNADLEKLMDTSDEWISQRTGIRERRHVDDGLGPSDLAVEASQKALKASGYTAEDMDFIIVATLSADHVFPGASAFLQTKLGLQTTPAMDLRTQCSGFIYALSTAAAFIKSGHYKKILIVGAEVHSPVLDFTTRGRDVAVLFGDGAGAIVVEAASSDQNQVLSTVLHTQGEFAQKLWLEKPGTAIGPWMCEEREDPRNFPFMDGKFVFKHAVVRFDEVIKEGLEKAGLQLDDVDHFLFHQANLRINEYVGKSMGIHPDKIHNNIQRYGNCSAASIPILLSECVTDGKIKKGDVVCMAAFGAGFTWASAIVNW